MLRFAVVAATSLALAASGAFARTGAALPSDNLVRNPGAEAAPGAPNLVYAPAIPEWQTTPNFTAVQYAAANAPARPDDTAGANFFAGGPKNDHSTATQAIDLGPWSAEIDSGEVAAELSAMIGGTAGQEDGGLVTASFRDGGGSELSSVQLVGPGATGRHGESILLPRLKIAAVPPGSRSAVLVLEAKRQGGTYNDGYFDNISLKLIEPSRARLQISKRCKAARPTILVKVVPVAGAPIVFADFRAGLLNDVRITPPFSDVLDARLRPAKFTVTVDVRFADDERQILKQRVVNCPKAKPKKKRR